MKKHKFKNVVKLTKEDVQRIHQELVEKTAKQFEEFRLAKIRSWNDSCDIVFD